MFQSVQLKWDVEGQESPILSEHHKKHAFIGAPSDAAAFNVQGSMLHHLLGIGVSRPEDNITQKIQDKLQNQLIKLLCSIIDKRSMLSSKVLGAAERNIQKTVYNGQNSRNLGRNTSSTPFWQRLPIMARYCGRSNPRLF